MTTNKTSTSSATKHVLRITRKTSCSGNHAKQSKQQNNHAKQSVQNSRNVIRNTNRRSSCRALTTVCFKLNVDVYRLLKVNVSNMSEFFRQIVYEAVEKLPVYLSMEEFQLEIEIARLADELTKVHNWQIKVLKHGSYAEAYLQKLKGGWVQDRKPFFQRDPPPFIRPEELLVVEDIVKYREKLAKQLVLKLNRVMQLKNQGLPEESFMDYTKKKKPSKSRGRMTKTHKKGGEQTK